MSSDIKTSILTREIAEALEKMGLLRTPQAIAFDNHHYDSPAELSATLIDSKLKEIREGLEPFARFWEQWNIDESKEGLTKRIETLFKLYQTLKIE